jgi:hypothetical protein
VVDDGRLCLLLSYTISRNSIWLRDARLGVFAVTTSVGCDHEDLEKMAVDFLQQIRINASVKIVTIQQPELADDFRAHIGEGCPKGSPKLTIRDKFLGNNGGDDESNVSSTSEGRFFGGLIPICENACLPNLIGAECNDDIHNEMRELQQPYVPFKETTPQLANYEILSLEMKIFKKFNSLIRRESPYASMVVTHLPLPHLFITLLFWHNEKLSTYTSHYLILIKRRNLNTQSIKSAIFTAPSQARCAKSDSRILSYTMTPLKESKLDD